MLEHEGSLGLVCSSVRLSFPMNLIQYHNESCDEHVVNMWEHRNTERVLSKQYVRDSKLTVHLQHQMNGKHIN